MNKLIWMSCCLLLCFSKVNAQDLLTSQVPSLILNKFQHDYPNAKDIEWKMKGVNYEVDFEIGWPRKEQEILFNSSGEIIRHKQEVSQSELPKEILQKIKIEFPDYRIKEVKRISEGLKIFYKVEIKHRKVEWELLLDSKGNILNKKLD